MSHEVETMAYANEVPWHGIGARVDQSISVDEMLEAAGLNWSVDLQQLHYEDAEGEMQIVPERFALVRSTDGRVLTITGNSWHPLQNSETLGFMRDYVEAGGASLETAGSLRGGKIIWGLAKLQHTFDVTKGDSVNGYLLFTSPHEVGKCITVRTTTVRVVCANTMAMANRSSNIEYKQNHMAEFDVETAKACVENAHEELAHAQARFKTLAKLKVNIEDAVKKVIAPVIVPNFAAQLEGEAPDFDLMDPANQPKKLREVIESINTAPGANNTNGWGMLNGVTHWADHVAGRDNASRMHRAWVGDTARAKVHVEEGLLELAA
jgi:phage/plasmid-like protein (TIGR03299 family)